MPPEPCRAILYFGQHARRKVGHGYWYAWLPDLTVPARFVTFAYWWIQGEALPRAAFSGCFFEP